MFLENRSLYKLYLHIELPQFLAELEPRLCLPFVYTGGLEQEDK